MKLYLGAATLLAFSALGAHAEEHRQLGPHQHGHGKLNIAIEGNKVSIELDVPGMDIAGFEHKPSTPEQKAALAKAEAALAQGLSLFRLSPAAECKLRDAKVGIEGGEEHENHEHEAKDGDKDAHEHEHSDFNAEYTVECNAPSRLTSIAFDYFKTFPGAQQLDVTVLTEKGQTSHEVTRDKSNLDLAGVM